MYTFIFRIYYYRTIHHQLYRAMYITRISTQRSFLPFLLLAILFFVFTHENGNRYPSRLRPQFVHISARYHILKSNCRETAGQQLSATIRNRLTIERDSIVSIYKNGDPKSRFFFIKAKYKMRNNFEMISLSIKLILFNKKVKNRLIQSKFKF